jgi:O-acetyl-ADP-ribose deacetylase
MPWLDGRLDIVTGDITSLDVDVIVNAANASLLGGGGVDGAIHRAAGPGLLAECRTLGGGRTGEVKLTHGHGLRARWIAHAVGPVWHGGGQGEDAQLASCYRRSLDLAREVASRTIAFPAISTGAYGYPLEAATRIAITTVRDEIHAREDGLHVIFCCFTTADARVYARIAEELLGA